MLKFREWIIEEAITLAQAAQLYGYKPGDVIDKGDLIQRYRKLAMQHHPDRHGNPETFKQVTDGREVLEKLAGQQLPAMQQPQRRWEPPVYDVKGAIREELERAIAAMKKGQPEDAFAAVSRLVDPYTGKLHSLKPILKTALTQWLDYYKQGFHNYLEPILVNAVKLV